MLRCIGVNRERLLVFDTADRPVQLGSVGTVKSNHHLTELVKLTFPRVGSRTRQVVSFLFIQRWSLSDVCSEGLSPIILA